MDHPTPPPALTPLPPGDGPRAAAAVGREAARYAAEPEVRAALELMPQLVWTTTPDGYHDYYNEQWYRYTGMPRPGDPAANAEGWNWKAYLHADDYDRTVALWAECLATGAPYEIEYRFKEAATGRYRWFLGRALPLREAAVDGVPGRIVRWFGTCTDIDEARRASEQLAQQAAELELTTQQLQEQQAELEVQAEALAEANTNLQAALADAVGARRGAEASRLALEATNADLARVNAALAHASALLAERTAAAETAQAQAEHANKAKSDFLATMSHELRTPLNAIGGYVQLLDMGLHGPVTEDQRGALGRVQGAQRRLLGLINDVLNYAKLESGRVEYDVRPVDVADAVRDVLPLVEPQLAAKGLAFDVRLPHGPCAVWADREKLGQVLVNLLTNATKFTDAAHPRTGAPGRVTLSVATRPGAAGDAVFVRVTDTGRGIPREKQAAIFEPFVQVRSGYAQATEGTGLGLAISRDLARGMGGDLRVRSRVDEGATFTVTLRRAAATVDRA